MASDVTDKHRFFRHNYGITEKTFPDYAPTAYNGLRFIVERSFLHNRPVFISPTTTIFSTLKNATAPSHEEAATQLISIYLKLL